MIRGLYANLHIFKTCITFDCGFQHFGFLIIVIKRMKSLKMFLKIHKTFNGRFPGIVRWYEVISGWSLVTVQFILLAHLADKR